MKIYKNLFPVIAFILFQSSLHGMTQQDTHQNTFKVFVEKVSLFHEVLGSCIRALNCAEKKYGHLQCFINSCPRKDNKDLFEDDFKISARELLEGAEYSVLGAISRLYDSTLVKPETRFHDGLVEVYGKSCKHSRVQPEILLDVLWQDICDALSAKNESVAKRIIKASICNKLQIDLNDNDERLVKLIAHLQDPFLDYVLKKLSRVPDIKELEKGWEKNFFEKAKKTYLDFSKLLHIFYATNQRTPTLENFLNLKKIINLAVNTIDLDTYKKAIIEDCKQNSSSCLEKSRRFFLAHIISFYPSTDAMGNVQDNFWLPIFDKLSIKKSRFQELQQAMQDVDLLYAQAIQKTLGLSDYSYTESSGSTTDRIFVSTYYYHAHYWKKQYLKHAGSKI